MAGLGTCYRAAATERAPRSETPVTTRLSPSKAPSLPCARIAGTLVALGTGVHLTLAFDGTTRTATAHELRLAGPERLERLGRALQSQIFGTIVPESHDVHDRPTRRCLHRRPAGLAAGHLPQGPCFGPPADPEVTETIKRITLPYFVLRGNVCALLAAKDHVNVFLYDGAIVRDPDRIITSGHENKTARTVAIRQGEPIKAEALIAMFRAIIPNNRARGWRRLKAKKDL